MTWAATSTSSPSSVGRPHPGDGVVDVFESSELGRFIGEQVGKLAAEQQSLHEVCAAVTNNLLTEAMARCSLDNVTAVLVGFEGLAAFVDGQRRPAARDGAT